MYIGDNYVNSEYRGWAFVVYATWRLNHIKMISNIWNKIIYLILT